MGVVFINRIGDVGLIGLWEITQPLTELKAQYELLGGKEDVLKDVSNEARQMQILCTRLLIKEMEPDFDVNSLGNDANGMPFIKGTDHNVSISHSGKFVTVALSQQLRAGIDIEKIGGKVDRISAKFMNEGEKKCAADLNSSCINEYQHVIWGAKEALFKLYGKGNVSFAEDLIIMPFAFQEKGHFKGQISKIDCEQTFSVNYERVGGYMLVYVFG